MVRGAGILMHISSLAGNFGIGSFGEEAYKFVRFLKKAGFKYWQILPLGHTGFGDSPYQCFDAFAGNPYFIDFDILNEEGLLKREEYINEDYGSNPERVDYGKLYNTKYRVLERAYDNYKNSKNSKIEDELKKFKSKNSFWLENYGLYMALKEHLNVGSWYNWDEDIRFRKKESMEKYRTELVDKIEYWSFIQYLFFKQWFKLKEYANSFGIEIIGDVPIYVAQDSVDTWSNPDNYKMDKDKLIPKAVSGCPPDTFSKKGQLWGNVIYDWDAMRKDNYKWWVLRVSENLKLFDIIRIDHFRGLESFWEIPYGNEDAIQGNWEKGPGMELFKAIKDELGEVNIIAEDLGVLTDEVKELLEETGYPGMKILQFAFDGNCDNYYLPHNYERNCVAYTGTHDNDTLLGWYEKSADGYSKDNAKFYLGLNNEEGINWGLIRGTWTSTADIAIAQMQDFLNIGYEGRMNLPSSLGENWSWRMKKDAVSDELIERIARMNYLCKRGNFSD